MRQMACFFVFALGVVLLVLVMWIGRASRAGTGRACPHCGGVSAAPARFCGQCGKHLE